MYEEVYNRRSFSRCCETTFYSLPKNDILKEVVQSQNSFQENSKMFDTPLDKELQKHMKDLTKTISIVIRNAMEDFYTKHLTDEQMTI